MFPIRSLNRRLVKDSKSGIWHVFAILMPALITVCLIAICFFPHLIISRFDNIPCPTPRCSTPLSFFHLDNLAFIIATILIAGTTVCWFRRLWNAIKNVSLLTPVSDKKLQVKLNRAITAIERLTDPVCVRARAGRHKLPEVKIFNSSDLGGPLCFTKGWLRPKIWISDALLSEMNGDDLQVVLAHEYCHVLRYDNLVSLILTFISELSWANSGCRTLLKGWYERRELFCDNFSARVVASRQKVALTLVKLAEVMVLRKGSHTIIPGAAFYLSPTPSSPPHGGRVRMVGDKPFIQTRVENLLCNQDITENSVNSYRNKLWFFALSGLCIFAFVVWISITLASNLTYMHCLIEDVFSFSCSAC